MLRLRLRVFLLVLLLQTLAHAQMRRTSKPLGESLDKALATMSFREAGAPPFHLKLSVAEPANPQSPYVGAYEEWWASPTEWRRVVTGPGGLRQTLVTHADATTEQDEGDYLPLWLRNFATALINPIPNAATWRALNATIDQVILPTGAQSDPCVRAQGKIGFGPAATDSFSNICFDSKGRLKFVGSPGYSMEFRAYRSWHGRQVPSQLADAPEPGTELEGQLTTLEPLDPAAASLLFTPLPANHTTLQAVDVTTETLEKLAAGHPPIAWPTVHSGNTQGHLAMYVSVDRDGHVREAWPLNSDNAGLEDAAREQVRQWHLKGATDAQGRRVEVDGAIAFAFDTRVDAPLPVLAGADAMGKQVTGCTYQPTLPPGTLPAGTTAKVRISVSEQGKMAGLSFTPGPTSNAFQVRAFALGDCTYHPYLVDGKPTYYFIDFLFTAP